MTRDGLQVGLNNLEFARRALLGLLEGFPADKRTHQPVSGANHLLWIVGHLANTDDWFVSELTNREPALPENYRTLFGMGSAPKADASAYPPFEDVTRALEERRTALLEWLRSLPDEQLARELPGDFKQFAPNFATLPATLAWHEGLHAGQITVLRKALGMKPAFG